MSLATNRSLAEKNLEYQPQLEGGKGRLQEKYAALQSLYHGVLEQKDKLDRVSNTSNTDFLLSTLQAEGTKVEEESEELAEKFLEGQFALEVFLEQYNEQRKLAHLRRIRIEKLQEILSRHRQPVAATTTMPPQAPDEPRPKPSPSMPLRPPPPVPRPPDIQQQPSVAYPLPYDPNPGMAGVPQQVMSPYPPAAPAPHFYPPSRQAQYVPYPVQGHLPSIRPPYVAYPMPAYSYGPSGPPPLPPRPGCRQPQPGYHLPQSYSQ
ncbi:vacuolar protein sorting-associated protein 37C-like [Scyliorhinus canicula]|uniref:vacuolar protein sorting-associated protein 37C-like n=1 Tax=Scyliorhinus canicula TaxID=7830 RepID=UPI0018F3BBEA|nr:vacuolar protein sorting-associated protein 37C-like [Scyliorhinus canicula]